MVVEHLLASPFAEARGLFHLGSEQRRDFGVLFFQQLGRFQHQATALRERSGPPFGGRLEGKCKGVLYLRPSMSVELFDDFFGGRVSRYAGMGPLCQRRAKRVTRRIINGRSCIPTIQD